MPSEPTQQHYDRAVGHNVDCTLKEMNAPFNEHTDQLQLDGTYREKSFLWFCTVCGTVYYFGRGAAPWPKRLIGEAKRSPPRS